MAVFIFALDAPKTRVEVKLHTGSKVVNIMRCFAGVFFWLFAQVAFAVHCQTDDRVWRDMRAETLIIYTDVKLDAENSRVTMKSAVPTVCRHNFPVTFPLSYREWIASTSDTFNQAPKFSAFSSGMIVGGNEYPWPLGPGRYLAEGSRSGPNYFFWLGMYLKLSSSPGLNIKIDAGDVIGNFHFFKLYNFTHASYAPFSMYVQIRARNSLDTTPPVQAECAINDNRPVNVDFGSVDPAAIGISASTSLARKTVGVKFVCDRALQSARLKLVATPSIFSAEGFVSGKPDIAIAMIRKSDDAIILPSSGLSYYVYLINGETTEEYTFSLFRKRGTFPPAGPFAGSGTLVVEFP
ncbi:fimbrial protein [Pseudomonas fragi]|uniref:fimbrial protein n=1 Tax=Pseudomonas fragi TaxID=296 RepID=UPI00105530E4|nr:fimbrial protein [Pseudomonas fragi]